MHSMTNLAAVTPESSATAVGIGVNVRLDGRDR
jgi:hypothetical protein